MNDEMLPQKTEAKSSPQKGLKTSKFNEKSSGRIVSSTNKFQ